MSAKPNHLYRQYFTPAEIRMLVSISNDDLTSGINLLSVLLARALAKSQEAQA